MKKKSIAAITALCMAGTVYASVGNVVNAEPVQSEHTSETTASQDRIYCIASVSKMYSSLAIVMSCIFMMVNERRKCYNKKEEFKLSGGEKNGGILTIKKYLSTWNCVK